MQSTAPMTDANLAPASLGQHTDLGLLQSVFSNMAEGVVVHDGQGAIQAYNPAALGLLGLSEGQLLGRSPLDPAWLAVHEDGSPWPGDTHPAMAALHTGQVQPPALMGLPDARAERRWLLVNARPLWTQGPAAASGALAVFADVTHHVHALGLRLNRLKLELANRELRTAHRHKTAFLQNLSHELRTPLNGIIGFGSLLAQGRVAPGTPKYQHYLGQITECSQALLAMVDRLLAVTAPALNLAELDCQAVDIRATVDAALDPLRDAIGERGVRLQVDIGSGLQQVRTDRLRLRQLLLALLDNAIKFSHAGGRVQVRATATEGLALQVEIEDEGIGIGPDDLERLFQPFSQLSTGMDKTHPGLGLGLLLAQRLAGELGGAIHVHSQPGLGSTFTLRLPPRLGGADPDGQAPARGGDNVGPHRRSPEMLLQDLAFEDPALMDSLLAFSPEQLDELGFGIIGFDADGTVQRYNRWESQAAGLSLSQVMGLNLFAVVAQCMNNYLVAQRFEDAAADVTPLDDTIAYVLTLRMKPARVKLRLLSQPGAALRFVCVDRRP